MKTIQSFLIDHTNLKKGVYISRMDKVSFFGNVTTFDVRMKEPYVDTPLKPETAHALEHCLATFLRNARKDVVYVGPMGCMTGFYVLLSGRKSVADLLPSLSEAFRWVTEALKIPGQSKRECGNYTFMDLDDAKKEAISFLSVLNKAGF